MQPERLSVRWVEPELDTPARKARKRRLSSRTLSTDVTSIGPKPRAMSSTSAQVALKVFEGSERDQAPRKERSDRAKARERQRAKDRVLLAQAIKHTEWQSRKTTISGMLSCFMKEGTLHKDPPDTEALRGVVLRAFPQRMDLPVLVCDVKATSAIVHTTTLGSIESWWQDKPNDVIVRWIHAPLGHGLLHSTVEDIFRHHKHEARKFPRAGGSGFPFIELDLVHFRERQELQHLRDVYTVLAPDELVKRHKGHEPDIHQGPDWREKLTKVLTDHCLDGDDNSEFFQEDLEWREKHRGKDRDFWLLTTPDIPLELSEHLGFHNHDGPLRPLGVQGALDPAILANDSGQFDGAHMVAAPFRCFHRGDGMLLTMSAAAGADQLHKNFQVDLKDDLEDRLRNRDSSVIANVMHDLEQNGAQHWHELSVEWFLVNLVTEVGIAPQNIVGGRNAVSALSALQGTIIDLKKRSHDPWQREKTVQLVKDYILCLDNLKLLSLSWKRKLNFFARLTEDLKDHESEDREQGRCRRINEDAVDASTAIERVRWASELLEDEKASVDRLFLDASQGLEALFQLRTIEQNEIAINADHHNNAVLIFTAVTVVFLPLSFFTSYYGMNLEGIRETQLTEGHFWKVCGTIALAIVGMVGVVALLRYKVLVALLARGIEPERGYKSGELAV